MSLTFCPLVLCPLCDSLLRFCVLCFCVLRLGVFNFTEWIVIFEEVERQMETPLFVKAHDWNLWLLQRTQRFPKHLRHSYTQRLESLAFDFEDLLLQANSVRGLRRRELLEAADSVLLRLRAFLRYAFDLQLLAANQLRYAGEQLDQLGRLLGAWLKGTDR